MYCNGKDKVAALKGFTVYVFPTSGKQKRHPGTGDGAGALFTAVRLFQYR